MIGESVRVSGTNSRVSYPLGLASAVNDKEGFTFVSTITQLRQEICADQSRLQLLWLLGSWSSMRFTVCSSPTKDQLLGIVTAMDLGRAVAEERLRA